MFRHAGRCGLLLLLLAATPAGIAAQDRLVRRFGGENGLLPPAVALAQDSVGFIWAGTRAGLFRYDGNRFERWASDVLPRPVGTIVVSAEGVITVVDADGRVLELTRDGARQVEGSARRSPDHTQIAAHDEAGRLWVITIDGAVAWREADTWRDLPADALQGDTARKLFAGGSGGGVLVAGENLWRVGAGSSPERLLDQRRIVDAVALTDGRTAVLATTGEIILLGADGRADTLVPVTSIPGTRAISLVERNGTLWAATDRYLIAVGPDGGIDVLGPDQAVVAGGPLLVDHEGGLWHAGFTTLSNYPEPGTRVWDQRHGLPSAHTRFVGRTGDVLWVTTWQGSGFLRLQDGHWEGGRTTGWSARGELCSDGRGGLFVGSDDGVRHLRGSVVTVTDTVSGVHLGMCSPSSSGGMWISSPAGLHYLSQAGSRVEPVRSFPFESADSATNAVLEDRTGRLWVGIGEHLCETSAAALLSGGSAAWTCRPLPAGTVHLNGIAELESGTLWIASSTKGVMHYADGRWTPLPDNARLPTRSVLNLVPSPRGGLWLVGTGILHRVAERPDRAGWTLLEQLGVRHGLPSVGGGDLLEEEDGTIWIATAAGVVLVPAGVRSGEPLPPRMALVEARVDGQRVSLEQPLILPANRNRLELRFAALTFRDPASVHYQVRLSPGDEWSDTNGQPFFNWVDLPAGRHQPQVRASMDGTTWSPVPAELAFEVQPPWYRTPWAVTLFVLTAAALLWGLYRMRLAYLLGLERQRTRIAMDLHDEMGSGLASIGILAGVLSDGGGPAERTNAPEPAGEHDGGRRIAQEVAATAEELGTALSDIVWSLDPHSSTLEELAARLAEHGGRLFADDVQFDTRFPARWPAASLPLPVLRNVLLIGLEALHNAARHADAAHVTLSLEPHAEEWVLAVQDDGAGLAPGGSDRERGRGLRAMRRRAAEIGGELSLDTRPGAGTTVRLRFGSSRRRLRWLSWLAGRNGHRKTEAAPAAPHEHAGAPGDRIVHR